MGVCLLLSASLLDAAEVEAGPDASKGEVGAALPASTLLENGRCVWTKFAPCGRGVTTGAAGQ